MLQQRGRCMVKERIYREAVSMLAHSFSSSSDGQLTKCIDQVIQREFAPALAARKILSQEMLDTG